MNIPKRVHTMQFFYFYLYCRIIRQNYNQGNAGTIHVSIHCTPYIISYKKLIRSSVLRIRY